MTFSPITGQPDNLESTLAISPCRLPENLRSPAWAADLRLHAPSVCTDDGVLALGGLNAELIAALRERDIWIQTKPSSSRLPVPYHLVPPRLRALIAGYIGRSQKKKLATLFPAFPVDLSVDALSDALALDNPIARYDRPPFITTHDIDSKEGLKNLLKYFLPIEERYGMRSVNYIVPCKWKLDHAILGEIKARGHQLGIHGYDHGNKTPFMPPAEIDKRLEAARGLVERYQMTGYRAPSLVRTPALLRSLRRIFRYDSSVPTTGGLFPTPGNGCATARPFMLEGITEIPLSMPRDGHLRFLGLSPEEILQTWKESAAAINRSHGITHLLTHCEAHFTGNPSMLCAYDSFLSHISEEGKWTAIFPDELVDIPNL